MWSIIAESALVAVTAVSLVAVVYATFRMPKILGEGDGEES